MSIHRATVDWVLGGGDFASGRYSRVHSLDFGNGVSVQGSSSSAVVPKPWSSDEALDPEAAFVGALSACHMLTFLDLARRAGFAISAYRDEAEGVLSRIARGKMAVTRVVLRPAITWGDGGRPTDAQIASLHDQAHEGCFIANSVTTEVVVEAAGQP